MTEPQKQTEPETLSAEALAIIKWQEENPDMWGEQDENGVDLARLRENLKISPAERLKKMDEGRRLLRWIQNARTTNPA